MSVTKKKKKMDSSLPLYLGTQRTLGGRPLMLKCLPSKAAHCSSLKSFFSLEQGSELQERNFIRRPTQYIPPFLGLEARLRDNFFYRRVWVVGGGSNRPLWCKQRGPLIETRLSRSA